MDRNGEGVITQQEYAQAAAPMSYAAPQPQYMQAQPQSGFEMMDRNGDGVVTRQEFAQAAQPAVQYAAAAQVQTYAAPMVQQQSYAAPPMQYAAPTAMAPLPTTYATPMQAPAQMQYMAPPAPVQYAPQMGFN